VRIFGLYAKDHLTPSPLRVGRHADHQGGGATRLFQIGIKCERRGAKRFGVRRLDAALLFLRKPIPRHQPPSSSPPMSSVLLQAAVRGVIPKRRRAAALQSASHIHISRGKGDRHHRPGVSENQRALSLPTSVAAMSIAFGLRDAGVCPRPQVQSTVNSSKGSG
jgi:hypothetical protein